MKVWSENFYRIVTRYENTIIAQFYGHTHADEFQMFYDPEDMSKNKMEKKRLRPNLKKPLNFTGRPVNIAYLGPSVTTFENHNPAYRIYHLDGDHNDSTGVRRRRQNICSSNWWWYLIYISRHIKRSFCYEIDWVTLIFFWRS